MTTATVLPFAGGELSSFDPQDNATYETTNAGIYINPFDPSVSRCAIRVDGGSGGIKSPTWAAAPDFWFHAMIVTQGNETKTDVLRFYDGATTVVRFDLTNSGAYGLTINTLQAGVLTSVATLNILDNTLNVFDVRVVSGASGSLTGFLNGTQIFSITGLDHSGFSGVTQMHALNNSGPYPVQWSQVICDSTAHVGDKLVTLAEDTASTINTGWTGAVSNINEIVLDDSLSVTSSAAGQVGTYYKNAASLGSWKVVAICIGARAQLTTGSPTNLQIALRTNGTNYFGPTTGLGFGFAAVCASWAQNPFTAADWDTVTAAAVEVGMQSIA